MKKKILAIVFTTVLVAGILIACGSNDEVASVLGTEVEQTEDATETVEKTEDTGVDIAVPHEEMDTVETSIEENELEGNDTEAIIERGSRQSPYKLGEKVILSVFASNLYDVHNMPATIEITLNEYNEEFVECEISLSDCETDSAVDFLLTLFPKIVDDQMTEIGQYGILQKPEGLSSYISMYNGGKTTGYIQLKIKGDEEIPQYVVLQYYKCSDINVPKEEGDWTETWFELSRE